MFSPLKSPTPAEAQQPFFTPTRAPAARLSEPLSSAASFQRHGFAVLPLDAETQRQARLARLLVAPYLVPGSARAEHLAASQVRGSAEWHAGPDSALGLSTDAGGARRLVYRPTAWDAWRKPSSPPAAASALLMEEACDMLAAQHALYATLAGMATDVLQSLLAAAAPEFAHCLPMLARQGSLASPTALGAASQTSLTAHWTPPEAEWSALLPFQQCEGGAGQAAAGPPRAGSGSGAVLTLSSRPQRPASLPCTDCTLLTLVLLPGDDERLEVEAPPGSGAFVNPLAHTATRNSHSLVAVAFPGELLDAALNASKFLAQSPPSPVRLALRQRLGAGAQPFSALRDSALMHVLRLQPPLTSDLNLQRILAVACGHDWRAAGVPRLTSTLLHEFFSAEGIQQAVEGRGEEGGEGGMGWGEDPGVEAGAGSSSSSSRSTSSSAPVALASLRRPRPEFSRCVLRPASTLPLFFHLTHIHTMLAIFFCFPFRSLGAAQYWLSFKPRQPEGWHCPFPWRGWHWGCWDFQAPIQQTQHPPP